MDFSAIIIDTEDSIASQAGQFTEELSFGKLELGTDKRPNQRRYGMSGRIVIQREGGLTRPPQRGATGRVRGMRGLWMRYMFVTTCQYK
jgi:hypothetical protein